MSPVEVATLAPTPASQGLLTTQEVLARNHVRIIGHGKPPVLLCNGFGYTQRVWQALATALAHDHQVILFDHVGVGGSDPAAYDADKYAHLAGYAQDLLDICRVLELEQAVLVGHSVGAMIALLAASQAPTYFAKVVLLTPSPCYLNEPGYYGGYERADIEQLLTLMQTDEQGWATLLVDLLLGPLATPELAAETHQCLSATASPMAQQFARVTFLSDHRAAVPGLTDLGGAVSGRCHCPGRGGGLFGGPLAECPVSDLARRRALPPGKLPVRHVGRAAALSPTVGQGLSEAGFDVAFDGSRGAIASRGVPPVEGEGGVEVVPHLLRYLVRRQGAGKGRSRGVVDRAG
jgi:sigma-B regulation protein RsbQ